jgi:acetyl esterase
MPVDPHIQQLLDDLQASGAKSLSGMTIEEVRAAHLARRAWSGPPPQIHACQDFSIPGAGGPIPVRAYRHGPDRPVLIWYHGGGFVAGSIEGQDPVCRLLAIRSGCTVLAVDYRLAPEHPFPAAVEDACAVLGWVTAHGRERGLDPARVAVGGDSAGANLATVAARRARDRNAILPQFQALVYPVTDATMSHPSYAAFAEGYMLTRRNMEWYFAQYLPPGTDPRHPDVSPLHASSLAGLPPAFVMTAEHDPLRDEGEAYAARLREAGVEVTLTRCPALVHGFFSMGGITPAAYRAVCEVARVVREAFE